MTSIEKLAAFVTGVTDDDLSDEVRLQLKIRILDALGCAIGASGSEIASQLRADTEEFGIEAISHSSTGREAARG